MSFSPILVSSKSTLCWRKKSPFKSGDRTVFNECKKKEKEMFFFVKQRLIVTTSFVLVMVLLFFTVAISPPISHALAATEETLTVPFANGPDGATTTNSYASTVTINVSGTGQASATAYSDAFYIFTDNDGNPITPVHNAAFGLCINNQAVDNYVAAIPAYSSDHTYQFTISVGSSSQQITFGVCDQYTVDNTGSFTITVTSSQRKQLFIDIQGINTSLSSDQANGRGGDGYAPAFFDPQNGVPGISSFLMANGYQNARYVVYSYAGFTTSGGPEPYTCNNTFTNPLLVDARVLAKQIASIADSTTDIYLVGHSLGGVVIYTYLAGYLEHLGNLVPLPAGAAIRGVITLDSPIGGTSTNVDYNDFLTSFYTAQCSGLSASTMISVHNMRQIFSTATDTNHRAVTVSIVKAIFKGSPITNQAVADAAKGQGIAILTIGNTNDLLWRPSVCNKVLGYHMTNFPSTQYLQDEGSIVYGRTITSGKVSCLALKAGGNHQNVLNDSTVEQGLTQFLPDGGVPSALAIAP